MASTKRWVDYNSSTKIGWLEIWSKNPLELYTKIAATATSVSIVRPVPLFLSSGHSILLVLFFLSYTTPPRHLDTPRHNRINTIDMEISNTDTGKQHSETLVSEVRMFSWFDFAHAVVVACVGGYGMWLYSILFEQFILFHVTSLFSHICAFM